MDVLILNCCYSICCCPLLHVCRVFHELWPHLCRLPPNVFPWCSTAAVQSLHEKKAGMRAEGWRWQWNQPKILETTEAFGAESTGSCPVMRGGVSVSLSGACVHWASLFWMEARIDAGFILSGKTPPYPFHHEITVCVTRHPINSSYIYTLYSICHLAVL